MITITVYADEVILRLDQFPRKLRAAVRGKFEKIFAELKTQTFTKRPGQFLDPAFIKSGIEDIGSTTVGYIEATAKGGTYPIVPTKARVLRFVSKGGEIVRARRVNHPFLKGAPIIERAFRESKPWIVEQLEAAVREAKL